MLCTVTQEWLGLACSCLGVEPKELFEIAVYQEVFQVLGLLYPQPSKKKSGYENELYKNSFRKCTLESFQYVHISMDPETELMASEAEMINQFSFQFKLLQLYKLL